LDARPHPISPFSASTPHHGPLAFPRQPKLTVLCEDFVANPIDLGTPHRSNSLNPFTGPFPDLGIVLD